MKTTLKLLTILPITLFLTGCEFISNAISSYWQTYNDKSEPFSPPENNQWITVEGIAPPNTKPNLVTTYASNRCLATHNTASGKLYHLPRYHWNKFNISTDPETGSFKEKVPFHGGGWCQWKINTVTVSLVYNEVNQLIKGAVPYDGTGIKAFINGAEKPKEMKEFLNIIDYRPTIYPFLRRDYDDGDKIGLYGKSGGLSYFGLRLIEGNDWKINYTPILDESKMPKIIISENPPGVYPRGSARVEYPDGKVDLNRDSIDYWKINNTSQ
ncbi:MULTISPECIES: hypothetical protein [Xenorhabdus]|uniref:Lipoprotein n=2 Tax=Xenorhabdus TaxID=626 RepID=W1INJ4_9GAMM|nr:MULTISPECIES: hypothetical protein [Xenorhabdus]PHM77115.1 hypothetical protein Xcab_02289 [Xenorhabdus cabanillasii JM26]CBJ80631.1 conserved hypothetical protein [Xenorhabdus bovienii SS-2004]CDH30340.1 conserved hypothetical protein [Xenorhabdus bovienii str. Jollieti]CDL80057.1 conserved hypothetical protein [Xenorhabdus cabanillasii JM26]